MATRIVTISHAMGAVGDSIGRSVAERLGFRYVDTAIIESAAKKHGLDTWPCRQRRAGQESRSPPARSLGSAATLYPFGTAGFLIGDTTNVLRREEVRAVVIEAI